MAEPRLCANKKCKKPLSGLAPANTIYCSRECLRKAYAEMKVKEDERQSSIKHSLISKPKGEKRKCHDCARPTTDYRCRACLTLWRRKHSVPSDLCEEGL